MKATHLSQAEMLLKIMRGPDCPEYVTHRGVGHSQEPGGSARSHWIP